MFLWSSLCLGVVMNLLFVVGGGFSLSGWFSSAMVLMVGLLWMIYGAMMLMLSLSILEYVALGLVMFFIFLSSSVWGLIIWFEFMLIPIMLAVISTGMNPARVSASMYMLMYTIVFSLPALVFIANAYYVMMFSVGVKISYLFGFWLVFTFGVKVPIYGFHLWLPKAHVEASTLGSMMLAGALLKGGTYGVFLVFMWSGAEVGPVWFFWGVVISSLVILLQVDVKKLLAMSSVMHLNAGLLSFLTFSSAGVFSLVLVSFSHGLVSSGLFYLGGLSSTNSRILFFLKSYGVLVWLVVLVVNAGLPPFISFLSEVLMIVSVVLWGLFMTVGLVLSGFMFMWLTIKLWLILKMQGGVMPSSVSVLLGVQWILANFFWLIL